MWTAAEGTHVVGSFYQFISLLSYDTLSKEKHIIGRNPCFVCVGFKRQWQRRRNWRRTVTPEQMSFDRVFFYFRWCRFFCYHFICLGSSIHIIWYVNSWDVAGNRGVGPAGMLRADLERSKAIKKPRGLGDISLWTEIGKPRSRIAPISGKVCANRGKDIIFAFESNPIFSIFPLWCLLYILYLFFFPGNLFSEGTFCEGWHSSLVFVEKNKPPWNDWTDFLLMWNNIFLCITCVTNPFPCSRSR